MDVLADNCAMIFSNVALHNGLSTIQGMVAVYGVDDVVNTLYKEETVNGRPGLENMLRPYSPGWLYYSDKNRKYAKLCLSESSVTQGLDEILKSLGFNKSQYTHEKEDTRNFMAQEMERIESGLRVFEHNSKIGKSIAAAVTTGRIRLSGRFACASNTDESPTFEVQINSPLNMGNLNVIAYHQYKDYIECLVFINSTIRIIWKDIDPYDKKETWQIKPLLNDNLTKKLLSRKLFNDFFYKPEISKPDITEYRFNQNVLLGYCQSSPRRSERFP